MAVTITLYNHTAKKLANKEITLTTLKLQLLNNSATFDATHTALTSVNNAGAYEVSGGGWDAGGEALANVAVTTVATNDAKLDADDISVTATGAVIGPAYKAVLYDDTDASDAPLAFIDFGGVQEAGIGTPFNVTWNAAGIFTFTVA
jgi:hypothetical protein